MIETIHIDDLTVACDRPANAARPPVLFVHGYFASATVFEQWLPFFASRGTPAYAVNLRGRADSRIRLLLGPKAAAVRTTDKSPPRGHNIQRE